MYIFTALPDLYIIKILKGKNNSNIGLLIFFEIHQMDPILAAAQPPITIKQYFILAPADC